MNAHNNFKLFVIAMNGEREDNILHYPRVLKTLRELHSWKSILPISKGMGQKNSLKKEKINNSNI